MAKKTTYHCDRCGKQFNFKDGFIARLSGRGLFGLHLFWRGSFHRPHDVELCSDCTKKLDEFLKGKD